MTVAAANPFDDLPEDDEQAFAVLEAHERAKLRDIVRTLEDDWAARLAEFDYINAVWAVARAAGITELAEYPIVTPGTNGFESHVAQFSAHAQRIVYDINYRAARTRRKGSVELSSDAKAKLHSLIAKMREVIEGADLDDEKKHALLTRVNALTKEIDLPRTELRVVLDMMLDVSATVGQVATNLNPLRKLVDMVIDIIAIARSDEPKQLPVSPRRFIEKPVVEAKKPPPRESFNQDLDDEIPF